MIVFESIAHLRESVGQHIGFSDWHTITQKQVDTFAHVTGDSQWIHVDPERAANGPFGATIAHGYLTLSLLPMLTSQVYVVENLKMGVNYGANKIRFPAPVPVGARVRAGIDLLSVEPQGGLGYQVITRVTIERDSGLKPACVVESVGLLVP